MATAKKPITRSTDPNVRKSPPLSASQFPEGHVSKGNDGNYWTISESGNGIKRWVPVSKTASKSSSTKSSASQTVSSTPAVETQQEALDRYNTYINKTSKIYYTLPKTNIVIYVEDILNILKYKILIGNNIIVDENDPDFKKQLMDWLSQRIVIKNATIFSGGRNDITDLSFEFNLHASSFEIIDELNLLDDFLYIKMNVRNGKQLPNLTQSSSTSSTETAVQEAETKVDDIVFSAPVVPVGTEDQRNATDILVDEFIAKNENNLKKLSVENVGLLSTIDKTLEFIKAKFGTPATISSVSNVVSAASQPAYPDNIDDYKLIQFIGDNGERQVIEFKKFKTGKNANVFKYFIGDVFLDTNSSNADADFVYKEIIGAQEGGVYAGYIHYIDSYPGKIGAGLTWDRAVRRISVGDFEGKIESGEWTSVPGANQNLKKLAEVPSTTIATPITTISKRSYELGNKVIISPSSNFYKANDPFNPIDTEGIIVDVDKRSTYPYKVQFSTGKKNSYKAKDLLLVTTKLSTSTTETPAPAVTPTAGGSSVANVGDTVTFYASREKTNLTGIVKAIVTGTDGKPYLRINVNGKFYLKQQGSVKKV
jgi:hypothetical protein